MKHFIFIIINHIRKSNSIFGNFVGSLFGEPGGRKTACFYFSSCYNIL